MTDDKTISFVAYLLLFCFIAFLFPQIANNAFASTTSSYAKPVMTAMISVILGAIVYLVAKKAMGNG